MAVPHGLPSSRRRRRYSAKSGFDWLAVIAASHSARRKCGEPRLDMCVSVALNSPDANTLGSMPVYATRLSKRRKAMHIANLRDQTGGHHRADALDIRY